MQTAWKFKLSPTIAQKETMESWQHSVGYFYNFCLGDRIRSHQWTKVKGCFCDIRNKPTDGYVALSNDDFAAIPLTCSVNKSASVGYPWKTQDRGKRRGKDKSKQPNPKRTAYEMHSSLISEWRQAKSEYKNVCADVLQQALRHLDKAFSNFFGHGFGYPRFKRYHQISFEFKPRTVRINGNRIAFPVLGMMQFFKSREIPDVWEIRTVTISREADGWYVAVLLRDETVPDIPLKTDEEIATVLGVDVGIRKIVSLSNGITLENPNFLKKQQRRLEIRQRSLSRKKKGSGKRKKDRRRVARLHQRILRQREDFQWKTGKKIAHLADVIAFEELNVKGMKTRCKPTKDEKTGLYLRNGQSRKAGLNKAISDASWYSLRKKTEHQASKLGNRVVLVDPRYSSQECSECHYISPSNRDAEKFLCENCGHHADADVDGAVVIAQRVAAHLGIVSLRVVSSKVMSRLESTSRKEISLPLGGEPGNPTKAEWVQLKLFDLEEWGTG